MVDEVSGKGTRLVVSSKRGEDLPRRRAGEKIFGLLKDWHVDPQQVKDELRSMAGRE